MNQLRAAAVFGLVFILFVIVAAAVLRPLVGYLIALFFLISILRIATRRP